MSSGSSIQGTAGKHPETSIQRTPHMTMKRYLLAVLVIVSQSGWACTPPRGGPGPAIPIEVEIDSLLKGADAVFLATVTSEADVELDKWVTNRQAEFLPLKSLRGKPVQVLRFHESTCGSAMAGTRPLTHTDTLIILARGNMLLRAYKAGSKEADLVLKMLQGSPFAPIPSAATQ